MTISFAHTSKNLIFAAILLCNSIMLPVVFGTDTSQPLVNFPAADNDNTMLGDAWFKHGFTLEDQSTTCTFDCLNPVSGFIALNGGILFLNQDLHFSNITTFSTAGTIVGNGHITEFPYSITNFPSGNNVFQDNVVYINNDLVLTSSLTFNGNCVLHGNGHTIALNGGALLVGANSSLRIINTTIKRIAGTNIQCFDNSSTLMLDNVSWEQNDSFIFDQGIFEINNDVIMKGNQIFAYQSTATSTILTDATLTLDQGFTFSYDTNASTLFAFADETATIVLNNGTIHATEQGLSLTKGTMIVFGNSFIASEIINYVDNGITLGDCVTADNDFVLHITSSAQLELYSGSLAYKNLNLSSLIMDSTLSTLYLFDNTTLNLYQSMNNVGPITFGNDCVLAMASSAQIFGGINQEGGLTFGSLTDC